MRTAVICLNGFLRPATNTDGIDPIGQALFHALKQTFRIVLLDDTNARDVQHWLGVYGITGHINTYTPPIEWAPMPPVEQRLHLLAKIRSIDSADLVIESDPACAMAEIRAGYTVMLYSKPEFALDIWDPAHAKGPRPWDQVVNEIDRQRTAKAIDTRLKDTED